MRLLIILAVIALQMAGCEEKAGVFEKEVVCVMDYTDSGLISLSFEEIKPLFQTESPDNGILFSVKSIEDIDFGQRINCFLKPHAGPEETQEEQYFQKTAFYSKARKGYDSLLGQKGQRPHSVIYRVIATELNTLAESKARDRILIIQSDLFESSDVLCLYREKDLRLLFKNPKEIKERLIEQASVSPLENVTVYFIYKPRDLEENSKYRAMLSIYREIITAAGGIVKTNL